MTPKQAEDLYQKAKAWVEQAKDAERSMEFCPREIVAEELAKASTKESEFLDALKGLTE